MVASAIEEALSTPNLQATFKWKYNPPGRVSAEDAARELRRIFETYGGVTPATVVEEASGSDAVLHGVFEWDDAVAGPAYREVQARELIRQLVVVYRKPDGSSTEATRYIVKVDSGDDPDDRRVSPNVYIPVNVVMTEDDIRRRYVQQALDDMLRWRDRYRSIQELADVFSAIDRALERAA